MKNCFFNAFPFENAVVRSTGNLSSSSNNNNNNINWTDWKASKICIYISISINKKDTNIINCLYDNVQCI